MGFEGELLDSTIPAVIDTPLSMLIDDGDPAGANDDIDVPVAEFQSSV